MKRIQFVITGEVQGVGYRYFCQVQAVRMGLTGFAMNRSDGFVEVEVQGMQAEIEEFAHLLTMGPRRAQVSGVEREERPLLSGETAFIIG
jgi:acylphosphatase